MKRFAIAAVAVVTVAFSGIPAAEAASGPDVAHFTLGNGLEVVVIPDHRTPVVTHMVWYRVGAPMRQRANPASRISSNT